MPSSRKKVKTNEWQEYSHKPTMRQKRFPERQTRVSSGREPSFEPTSYQSTLTQVNFVSTPSFEDDEDSSYSPDSATKKVNKKRKREDHKNDRRTMRRQSTLTQMPFFTTISDSEDDLDEQRYDSDGLPDPQEDEKVKQAIDNTEDEEDFDQMVAGAGTQLYHPTQPYQLNRAYDPADQDLQGYEDGLEMSLNMKRARKSRDTNSQRPRTQTATAPKENEIGQTMIKQKRVSVTPSPQCPSAIPGFKTPQKPIKLEIPSSQSPAATPLTLSRLSASRMPLQELNANAIAQRDNTPTPIRSSQPLLVDPEEEPENINPVGVLPKLAQQLLTPTEKLTRLLPNASPSPTKRLSSTSSAGPSDEQVFRRPRPHSKVVQDSQEESQFTAYYTPTSSPLRPLIPLSAERQIQPTTSDRAAIPVPTQPHFTQHGALVPSSQATTVDLTQPPPVHPYQKTARQEPLASPPVHAALTTLSKSDPVSGSPLDLELGNSSARNPFLPIPSSAPLLAMDSQFQLPNGALGESDLVEDIANSADIVTVSQLCGATYQWTQIED